MTPLEAKRPVPPGLKSRFFGDYEIIEEIARGGMGVVYRARQLSLNRLVALKMIQSHHLLSDEARLRFRVEIEAVAQLHHPHIVSLYESGEQDGAHYFTMSLIEGGDLAEDLKRERPLRQRIGLLVKICRAIHYAHQRGILHRDLKPSNILVDEQGEPHVADFGLAKSLDHDTGLTFTSSVLGSPNYMAPEQVAGKTRQLTTAVDVYGLGAILYYLLAGRPPFQAETPIDTLRQVVDREPASPRQTNPQVDRDLETIALKCLRKEPDARYGTAEELALDLERWLAGLSILARPLGPLASGWRWSRRHPGLVLLGAALVTSLIALAVGSTVAAWRIRSGNQRTEALVTRMQIQKAEDLFSEGESSTGLATLAHVVRRDPANVSATLRLLSALQHRRYALPVFPSVQQNSPLMIKATLAQERELFTLTQAGAARRWDLNSGKLLNTQFDVSRPVRIAAMADDGSTMFIGWRDGTAELRTGPALDTMHELSALPDGVVKVAFSSSHRLVAAAHARLLPSFSCEVGLWDIATGRLVIRSRPHRLLVTDLQFTRDEKSFVTVCADSQIRFWPVSGDGETPSLELTQAGCLILRFDASGRWMAVGEYDGGIKVWDTQDLSQPKWTFQHSRRIHDLSFSPDSTLLLSASFDDTAQVWNLATGKAHAPALRHGNMVISARFSPDGRQIVTASSDNSARLWDTATGLSLSEELPHESALGNATFLRDGRRILTTTMDGAFVIWELREPHVPTLALAHSNAVYHVQFSPDGNSLASGSFDGEIRISESRSGKMRQRFQGDGLITAVAYSPDGQSIAAGGSGRMVRILDVNNRERPLPALNHSYSITGLEFDRSGTRLLVTAEVQAQMWDAVSRSPIGKPLLHRDRIESARLSPDGQHVISASIDHTVRLWSAATGEPIGPPMWDGGLATYAEFSPDGERILVARRSHEAFLISIATRKEIGPRMRHRGAVIHATFNRDGTRIVTASEDQTAKVWAPYASEPLLQTLPHRARVSRAEFSRDGRMILTLSSDGTMKLWDAASGHVIAEPIHHPGATFACFSPDGRRVAVSSKTGAVIIRPIPEWTDGAVEWMATLAEQVAQQRFVPPDRFDPLPPEALHSLRATNTPTSRNSLEVSIQKWFRLPSSH